MSEFFFIFQYGFTILGALFLIGSFKLFLIPAYDKSEYATVVSQVIDVKKIKYRGHFIHQPTVQYNYQGVDYTFDNLDRSSYAPSIGEKIEIYVHKNKPHEALASIKIATASPLILLVMGTLFTIAGVGCFYFM